MFEESEIWKIQRFKDSSIRKIRRFGRFIDLKDSGESESQRFKELRFGRFGNAQASES